MVLLFILLSPCCLGLISPNIQKSDFSNTEWFTNNYNNCFYTKDTISIVQILKYNNEDQRVNKIFIKLQYNNNKDISELYFQQNGSLKVEDLNVHNWDITKLKGKWKWNLDAQKQVLNLVFTNKHTISFRILDRDTTSIIYNNRNGEVTNESKLSLLTVKLLRLKK
jgi:hypothetical protein